MHFTPEFIDNIIFKILAEEPLLDSLGLISTHRCHENFVNLSFFLN